MHHYRFFTIWMIMIFMISCQEETINNPPNIILILTDDQGSVDAGCYGASDLLTPHIDQLAATGTRFSQFYVGSAVCSPSRAALMTGMTPQGAGLTGNASSMHGQPGMQTDRVTIAEMLKKAGYSTAHIGKWHLGYSEETMPLAQGFDYSFGHMGGCIDNYSHFFYWNGPNRHDLWENGKMVYAEGQYFPDMMVAKARSFIQDHQQKPFFMYLAFNTPHYPLQPTQKWRTHYDTLPMPRRDYAAFVSTTDERIGQIVETIEKKELREHTIIIYLSDHGHSYEVRTFGGGGSAGPFRGGKTSLFEGGIRVPAIISWRGHLPEGKVSSFPVMSMDLLPTIAELCGISNLPKGIEGKSLVKTIHHNTSPGHGLMFWQLGKQWAVREGDWKLIGNPVDPSDRYSLDAEKDGLFLSNLKVDSTESVNLATQYPEKVDHLLRAYMDWEYGNVQYVPAWFGAVTGEK